MIQVEVDKNDDLNSGDLKLEIKPFEEAELLSLMQQNFVKFLHLLLFTEILTRILHTHIHFLYRRKNKKEKRTKEEEEEEEN